MLNMETSIRRRRRILLHFLVGIALPSLLLGYLAFRGIRNDMELLEKDRLSRHSALAQQIAESVDEKISAIEKAFLDSIANRHVPQQGPAGVGSLEHLKSRQPFVEEIFLFESAEQIQFPFAKLLFRPDGSAESVTARRQPSVLLPGQ